MSQSSQSMHEEIISKLGPQGIQQMASLLGTDAESAKPAIQACLATVICGMARNCGEPKGAQSLRAAMDDHSSAEPFRDIAALANDQDGQRILAHVLGVPGSRQAAEGIAQFMGMNSGAIMKMMAMVAPMAMAMMAQRIDANHMDATAMARELRRQESAMSTSSFGDMLSGVLGKIFGGAQAQGGAKPKNKPQRGQRV
uniref:DUF937 domain-containing protein n=1 Tax=Herbidospora sakaeratensis TaxID=564415 RepID=UPI000A6F96B3|nr:DUF937 domain-containing protein [Herbidospora sakaeratensis]